MQLLDRQVTSFSFCQHAAQGDAFAILEIHWMIEITNLFWNEPAGEILFFLFASRPVILRTLWRSVFGAPPTPSRKALGSRGPGPSLHKVFG